MKTKLLLTLLSILILPTTYEVTGYCLNKNLMASGRQVYSGAVACPGFLKLGTKVKIKGREYVCQDRMHQRYRNGNYIDIWFPSCSEALKWGRRKQEVFINQQPPIINPKIN